MPSINPKVIADLRALEAGGAPGLVRELIDLFLREAEGHLTKLRDGLGARDIDRCVRASHTLKGSSGNLGAQAMSLLSAELNDASHSADWNRVSELLPKLEAEFRAVRTELEAEKERT